MPEAGSETKLLAGPQCNTEFQHRVRTVIDPQREPRVTSASQARDCAPCRIPLEMRRIFRRWLTIPLVSSVTFCACGSRPRAEGPLFGTGVLHPPPKPGTSISQTRMCECKACEPSSCCEGPDEAPPPVKCGESYDFSSNEACGISVRSCASRCARQVWRVKSTESCSARQPSSCCEAG
jgi:hypothetical protein